MAATRKQKEKVVEEMKEKFSGVKSLVFTDYRGLDVHEMTELRSQLRDAGVEYKVIKNTLARIAASEVGLENINDHLVGPIAVAFGVEDAVSPAKVLVEFAKNHDDLEIKAGLLNGEVISAEKVTALSKIPSREVLLSQVARGVQAPLAGLVNVLQGNIRGLVQVLGQIKEQKEAH
ncbi:MAG: 50S ribosomal protein L10 [Halanaerobium sp.]|nr:50S ribosomal protein L10 [Halanaerobium sp.]